MGGGSARSWEIKPFADGKRPPRRAQTNQLDKYCTGERKGISTVFINGSMFSGRNVATSTLIPDS